MSVEHHSKDLVVPDSPWSTNVPTLQVAWDSTSMKLLQSCPRKYQYSQIQSYQSKRFQAPLVFGILFHKATEIYDVARLELDHDGAQLRALDFCLKEGLQLNESTEVERNRFTLTRAVLWYTERYKNDPMETLIFPSGKAALEVSFRVALPLTSPDGQPYIWCGHIDRLGRIEGEEKIRISDRKTTKYNLNQSYFDKYSPDIQMSGYAFGASVILGEPIHEDIIIDGVEVKVTFNRFHRGFTSRTPAQLEEWVENTLIWIQHAEQYAQDNKWPMNLESCDKYGGCQFRKICSLEAPNRKTWLEADFKTKEWNPLANREA